MCLTLRALATGDGEALGREQDDAGALDVREGLRPICDDGGQVRQVGGPGDHADSLSHASDSHGSTPSVNPPNASMH